MSAQSGCRLCGARLTETFVDLRMSPGGTSSEDAIATGRTSSSRPNDPGALPLRPDARPKDRR
jgi:hypothetical protein